MAGGVQHPARIVPMAFLGAISIGTALLLLPVSRGGDRGADFITAAFTSVSATCVTGLSPVDPATYWSPFGQAVILLLIQVGGFGIMTLATLLSLLVAGKLGLNTRLIVQSESRVLNLGDVRSVLRRVAVTMAIFELSIAVIVTARFRIAYDDNLADAVWHGVFHAVSAFNNAGFALYSNNLIGFVDDPWISLPLCAAVVAGGLGFPVLAELHQRFRRPRYWTVHTRLTVYGSLILLAGGILGFLAFEWANAATIGNLSSGGKAIAAVTGGVMPRTAGFNSVDYGQVTPETLLMTDILMFIGGGSAGTAGGIKVGTFFLLGFVIWSEIRGEPDVNIAHRAISSPTVRQALTVALLGVGVVTAGTMVLLMLTDFTVQVVFFESISAFATVGLTTGITSSMPWSAELVLMVLMFVGRVGTITVATGLALQTRHRHYQLPEERPIVG
ncbi:MAG: TrkH family potassium uptake protein [Nocardioidaceae bacterium]